MDLVSNTPESRKLYLKEKLKAAQEIPGHPTSRVEVEGRVETLTHFSVPIDFPLYRLENGRTLREQREYLYNNPGTPSLFVDREFEDEAQKVQGQILENMVSENKLDELLKDGQREPLLLTSTGYVLNGNRRLAALRMMHRKQGASDPTRGYVDVVVLRDLDRKELSAIETRLQMSEEGKAPYSWINQLLKIENDIREFDLPEIDMARQMNVKTPTIQSLRCALTLVDDYLERKGWAGEYWRVDKQQQAFETLAKKFKGFEGSPETQERLKSKAFAVIAEPPKGKTVHIEINEIAKHINDFEDLPAAPYERELEPAESDDLLSRLSRSVAVPYQAKELLKDDLSPAERVRQELVLAKTKAENGDLLNLPIRNAKEANLLLAQIRITSDITQQKQLKGQLQGIISRSQSLISDLDTIAKNLHPGTE